MVLTNYTLVCLGETISRDNSFSQDNPFSQDIVDAAIERTEHQVQYNGAYFSIKYPEGDVPAKYGVCTDVIIRSFREIGTDLQKEVHDDISRNFDLYPSRRIWGLSRPDSNIDHRRVANLQVFFSRKGKKLAIGHNATDYKAGDLVTWLVDGNLPHIGIVSNRYSSDGVPLIVHNIGSGPKLENMLFKYPIDGHFRYVPANYGELKTRKHESANPLLK